ncbi:UPF0223 family protein [Staphylococcus sp. SQ8-PEA]|uniref:UPF0223 protein N9R04_02780 n=1 Tax=Staphylococcus marylandisciuri TaxID=2981529 RepID=A0ABT2QNV4_9STAP|nr:UPF0223 family protein [Staphylococcus marylandisciuri]MCU5745647.1 UPF0223 family protein [Staphylococcus marylandisciuri]
MDYHYPLDLDWSNDEMMDVISFFNQVEAYYESYVIGQHVIDKYRRFKEIIPSKAEEKQIFKTFEKASGYNSYQVVQKAKSQSDEKISNE